MSSIGAKVPEYALDLEVQVKILPDIKTIHVNCDSHSEVTSVYYYDQLVNPKFFSGKWTPPGGAARYLGRSHGDNYVEVRSEDLHTKGSLDMKYDRKGIIQ